MADQKITQLTEDTSLSLTDLIATVEDPTGTPVTKKATLTTLQKLLLADAWVPASDTWTFASASTFTIAGVDRTAVFTKGTRLKFTQTTAKYAVVVSSSFSTDTTVTILVNSDYTIANAAITNPYFSYANPPDYPDFFNTTTTVSGSGSMTVASTSINHCKTAVHGRQVTFILEFTTTLGGTVSNAVGFTTPIAQTNATNPYYGHGCAVRNGDSTWIGSKIHSNDTSGWLILNATNANFVLGAGFICSTVLTYDF